MTNTNNSKKIIVLLMLSQACYLSAMSIDLTITALVGTTLASNRLYATLPMALISIFSVIVAPQIPKLATRLGLKNLLISGGGIAAIGGIFSWYSLAVHSFLLLCIGTSCVGIYQAIANYYRYVAADTSRRGQEVRSISLVLTAGVFAAIIGPLLATWSSQLLTPLYSGAYLLVSVLGIGALFINTCLPKKQINATMQHSVAKADKTEIKIGFSTLLKRASFRNGALILLCSCFSMSLIMAGAPIFMQNILHNSATQRMFGMQLHMVGMYLPVIILLFVAKYLALKIQIMSAAVIGIVAVLTSAFYVNHTTIMITLLLIGVFWSLSYASGSALLTQSYTAQERQSARGKGEMFPVLGLAIGSLLAGPFSLWTPWPVQMSVILLFILMSVGLIFIDWHKI